MRYILVTSLIFKNIYFMKTVKKDVAGFQKLTKNQMNRIQGGTDVIVVGPDGKVRVIKI